MNPDDQYRAFLIYQNLPASIGVDSPNPVPSWDTENEPGEPSPVPVEEDPGESYDPNNPADADPVQPPTMPDPLPVAESEEGGGFLSGVGDAISGAADSVVSTVSNELDVAGNSLMSAYRVLAGGANDVVNGFLDTTDEGGEVLNQYLGEAGFVSWDNENGLQLTQERPEGSDPFQFPPVPHGGGIVEESLRGITQFVAGMAMFGGVGKGVSIAKSAATAGLSGSLFDPVTGNLATMAKDLGVESELLDYLDSKVGEDADAAARLMARLKMFSEELLLSGAGAAVVHAIAGLKKSPALIAQAKHALTGTIDDIKSGQVGGGTIKSVDDAGNPVATSEVLEVSNGNGGNLGPELPRLGPEDVPGQTIDESLENAWTEQMSGNVGVKGSTNVLDDVGVSYNNKPIHQWSPNDFAAVGDEMGIERLGPASEPHIISLPNGREVNIPGGTEGKFTYYDMLSIKSQGIDASQLPEAFHAELQKKMSRSLTLDTLTDDQVWTGLAFGMTSPNNPLFPNQLAMSRLRGPAAIDELASSISWKFGDEVDPAVRAAADKEIAAKFGLNAGDQGGLGVRGTQNYTRVAEMAQLFKENPEFFRRNKGEEWPQFAERVFSQVSGLRAKTGSFSVVFQDPLEAGVSAIDRHMGRLFQDKILADPKARLQWRKRAIKLYNSRKKFRGKKKATTMAELPDGFIGEMILSEVGKTSSPKFRLADGTVNPNVPERLRGEDVFIIEPKQAELMGEQYKAALAANQEEALKHGLGIFSSQWMLWDRMRRRLEPHENMFPGLERIPRPSIEQARAADAVHRDAGFKDYTKEVVNEAGEFRLRPTKPVANPAKLAYFSFPLALMMMQGEEE